MRISVYNCQYCQKILMVLMAFFFAVTANAAEKSSTTQKKDEIRISANRLVVNNESKFAEFIGNVRAAQGDTIITADKLRIFYKEISDKSAAGKDSIDKIIARGNVKITFEDKVAEAEEATYMTSEQVIVLSGPNSKITTGKDTIFGSKITLDQSDGTINVEGSEEKQVEVIFYAPVSTDNDTKTDDIKE